MNSVRAVPFLSTCLSGSRTRPRRFSSLGRSQDLPPTLDNAQHDAGGRGGQCEPRPLGGSQGTERLAVGDLGGGMLFRLVTRSVSSSIDVLSTASAEEGVWGGYLV